MHFILCKSSKLYSIMEVKVWLIDRISEEELWLVEIKFGGILNMVTAKVSKLPSEFATKYHIVMNKKVFKISQDFTFHCQSEWNNKKINKYRTVGIIPKSNIKIVERGKIDTPDSEGRLRTKLYDKRDNFNFPIVNFLFICSNIPAAPVHGVYISQLIRYSRACGSYQDFPDRGLLLTRKLLINGSSLRKCYGRNHDLVDRYGTSVSQMTTNIFHLA